MMTKGENVFAAVKGILFDLDGVVHIGDTAIPGAAETLTYLAAKNIRYRFVTNTTTKSQERIGKEMADMGLPIKSESIFTTHRVAAEYLKRLGKPTCYLLVTDEARPAYDGIPVSESAPRYVVIGDIGERWNYALLNRVFNMIMDGAEIIALHKGRYWKTQAGLQMDIGAFVAGLEYTTGKEATVIGKPSAAFFEMALGDLGLKEEDVIMVGDDIESDIGGAQRIGIRGVLVKTGKYREDVASRSSIRPHTVIDSVVELRRFF